MAGKVMAIGGVVLVFAGGTQIGGSMVIGTSLIVVGIGLIAVGVGRMRRGGN